MAATHRSSAPAHAALAALFVACALAAPEYSPYSSYMNTKTSRWKPVLTSAEQGYHYTQTTQRNTAPMETNVVLARKAEIIPPTESRVTGLNNPEATQITNKPNGFNNDYNNDIDISKNGDSENGKLGNSKPLNNAQPANDATIHFITDKPEADASISHINPNKINPSRDYSSYVNSSIATSGIDDTGKMSAPESEPQGRPLFLEVSKPVNQRFPHAVLFGSTCGGSIISPTWILSAGHCTLFTGGRFVLAGTNRSDDGSGVTRRVKKLHVHPLFTVGPYWLDANKFDIKQVAALWDFMLIELEEPLELDGVTLAAIPLEESEVAPGTYAGYAGYGTDHHGGTMRMEMHAMDLQVKADKDCRILQQYRKSDMLCAQGYAPKYDSACNGDSGSGLVAGGRLAGVASWVQNDAIECKNGNLVVFSKVAAARRWIKSVAKI